jgi:hypothetical protein
LVYAPDFADPNGSIYAFSVGLDGTLSPVPGSPFATERNSGPKGIASLSNGLIFVTLNKANQMVGFSADGSGALTALPGSPFATGQGPSSIMISPGDFVYVLNSSDHTISAYSINFNSGNLATVTVTEVNGSPFAAGTAAGALAIYAPSGAGVEPHVLYAADTAADSLLAFSINTVTGVLTPLAGSPFPVGAGPVALAVAVFPGKPPVTDPP